MKKLNILIFSLILSTLLFGLLHSCGTEDEGEDESLIISMSSDSVPIGTSISFNATSNLSGTVTDNALFFVNGVQINGNSFTPSEVINNNEVYATYNGKTSNTLMFASTEVIPSEYTQKVLVEDYTGTWCGYCPRLATILDYLTEYSNRIIPIAIHCPGAPTDPWAYEFANEMTHPDNYNAGGQPKGKINRIHDLNQFQGEYPCPSTPSVYTPQLDPYLNKTAPLGLAINSSLTGNKLNIEVKVGFATDNIPGARLVVNLIEDGLIYDQVNYYQGASVSCDPNYDYTTAGNPIPNFPQEHVLLKSYTDIFGDEISQDQIFDGNIITREFNVNLPENVTNSQNLTLVAFVLGNGNKISNREVINVQSAHVGSNQPFD